MTIKNSSPATVSEYLDAAKIRAGIVNDSQLAKRLKIRHPTLCQLRNGDALPGEDLLFRIVELMHPQRGETQDEMKRQALLYLGFWRVSRAFKSPEAIRLHRQLLQFYKQSAPAILIALGLLFASPAHAADFGHDAPDHCILWKIYISEKAWFSIGI